jgi:hypothetical protein
MGLLGLKNAIIIEALPIGDHSFEFMDGLGLEIGSQSATIFTFNA